MSNLDKFNYDCDNQISIFDIIRQPISITKPIRLIELFAGYGSQAMALKRIGANFEHYRVVEFDKYAIKSYNAVHGTDFPAMDIKNVHADDLNICDTDKYCYFMTYSFPCTDLSLAGKRAGMAKGSGTRSGLLWEVERILREIKESNGELPQILFMENVPQVHAVANMSDFQSWIDFLNSLGYVSYWQDLNAKNYGVAQNRNRCFMFSLLGNFNYKFPQTTLLTKRIRDYLEKNVSGSFYLSDKAIKCLTEHAEKQKEKGNNYAAVCKNQDEITPTITSRYYKDGSDCLIRSKEPIIVAMRGRNPDNPSDRTSGIPTEQRLEPNMQGISNCLTSVQKDNLVMESQILTPKRTEYGKAIRKAYESGKVQESRHNMTKLEPRDDGIANTLTTVQNDNLLLESNFLKYQHRIRRLTPKECGRLMGVSDDDITKMANVNSNTQLYKQFGNSIVVDVMCEMFKNLNIDQEDENVTKRIYAQS